MRLWVPYTNGTIYINADGSVDPSGAPIRREGDTYTLTSNITGSTNGIVIERNNMTLDGAGYSLQGSRSGNGIDLSSGNNVTAQGTNVINFSNGIVLSGSTQIVSGNSISNCGLYAVVLGGSQNIVIGNKMTNNFEGVVGGGSNNTVSGNNMTSNEEYGVFLYMATNVVVSGNNLVNNSEFRVGILIELSSNNRIYHNNFINNGAEVLYPNNVWDSGYPSGGNYWSDYSGADIFQGVYQNVTGSDGIGDTPFVMGSNNTDNYPLMTPWTLPDIAVTNSTPAKTIIGLGYNGSVDVNFENLGSKIEGFNATLYANSTCIYSKPTTLIMTNHTLSLTLDTMGLSYGNYTITSSARFDPSENATTNNCTCSVIVTIPGDLNGDFRVSLADLVILANAYGFKPKGHSKWNPNADIDGNGIVGLRPCHNGQSLWTTNPLTLSGTHCSVLWTYVALKGGTFPIFREMEENNDDPLDHFPGKI